MRCFSPATLGKGFSKNRFLGLSTELTLEAVLAPFESITGLLSKSVGKPINCWILNHAMSTAMCKIGVGQCQ